MKISSGKTYTGKLHNKNLFIRNDTYLPRRYNCSNFIQMAKRKNDCSLDNFIARFLGKRKYGKTLKLFKSKVSKGGVVNSKAFDGFENFLKEKIISQGKINFSRKKIFSQGKNYFFEGKSISQVKK